MNPIKHSLVMLSLIALIVVIPFSIPLLHATGTDILHSAKRQPIEALPQGLAHTLQDKLPPDLTAAVARELHKELLPAYHIRSQGEAFHADNPSHGMTFTFTQQGPQLQGLKDTWQWNMTLKRYGYEGAKRYTPVTRVEAHKGQIAYNRGPTLTEWYLNTPWGLEQGFTLHAPPAPSKGEYLVLEVALSGTLQASLQGKTLLLCDAKGEEILRYTGLTAVDSTGKTLPARLALQGETLSIIVDDTAASYPLTIDPWVQQAKLQANNQNSPHHFGKSVSLSGTTVVVGAPEDSGPLHGCTECGCAYIFEKPSGEWSSMCQTDDLLRGGTYDHFGTSVSISGNELVVGAPGGEAAYVYENTVYGWTYKAKLTCSYCDAGDLFGTSVATSGGTVVVGAPDYGSSGTAFIFVEPVGGWTDMTQTATLFVISPSISTGAKFGTSVAIDGGTVVVGADHDDIGSHWWQGSAFVFREPLGGWSGFLFNPAKLTANDGSNNDAFGYSVAISCDTVVAGSPYDDDNGISSGSAYIFKMPSSGWTNMTQTAKLTASDGAADDNFGVSVAFSYNANRVVVGAYGDNNSSGSAYIFDSPSSGWSTTEVFNKKLNASDGTSYDYFGESVSIWLDNIVVVGAPGYYSGRGSAYVFSFKAPQPLSPIFFLLLEDSN